MARRVSIVSASVGHRSTSADYFCGSYLALFRHADERFGRLRDRVRARQRYLDTLPMLRRPPERNDPCPCGSGKKHKACCGDGAMSQSYVFQAPG